MNEFVEQSVEAAVEKSKTDKIKDLLDNTAKRIISKKKIGRNEKCPCGSGLKFKKCCIYK